MTTTTTSNATSSSGAASTTPSSSNSIVPSSGGMYAGMPLSQAQSLGYSPTATPQLFNSINSLIPTSGITNILIIGAGLVLVVGSFMLAMSSSNAAKKVMSVIPHA